MTTLPRTDAALLANLNRMLIGFDDLFTPSHVPNYPPHNIIKIDDDRFEIQIAVAGFSRDQIEIEVEGNQLVVRGHQPKSTDEPIYIHRGLATRDFKTSFKLAAHVEIQGAKIDSGILTIQLERIVPDTKKPRLIAIE